MRKPIIAIALAAAGLIAAGSASAQDRYGYDNRGGQYQQQYGYQPQRVTNFEREFQRIDQHIMLSLRRGEIRQNQAQNLRQEVRAARQMHRAFIQDRRLERAEVRQLEQQVQRLHRRLERRTDDDRRRDDRGWNDRGWDDRGRDGRR